MLKKDEMQMNVRDIEKLGIKGFLDAEEGKALYGLALGASTKGPVLEIGGYCGKSTVYLGLACRKNNGILFSIDHHRGSEEQQPGQEYFDPGLFDEAEGRVNTLRLFRKAVEEAGLEDTVIPVVAHSTVVARMWATPLSLVFIDGGHSYSTVFSDYSSWMHHVMPGGYLLIHDIFTDVRDGGLAPYTMYRKALDSGLFTELPRVRTLGVLRRLDIGEVPEHIRSMRDY